MLACFLRARRLVWLRRMCLACLPALLLGSSVQAQPDEQASAGRWAVLPALSYEDETSWAFGVLPQYFFYTTPGSRPSSVRMDAYYTLKRQFNVQLTPSVWLRDNRLRISGRLVFRRWPTTFFGVGNDTPSEAEEPFTEQRITASVDVLRRFGSGFFVGASYALSHTRIRNFSAGGLLAQGEIPGSQGRRISGPGLLLGWDTRDNIFYPATGGFYQLSAGFASPPFGSDYTYGGGKLDLRAYRSLFAHHVLALQAVVAATLGTAPFRQLPSVGDVIRGYGATRYTDRHLVAFQAEYRIVPVWWRLGLVFFAGAGQVAASPEDLRLEAFHPAAGVGLRFHLYRREGINIRLDYVVGTAKYYLDIAEAF